MLYIRFYCILDFVFFASRRRHTRLVIDWSADVCSSDLSAEIGPRAEGAREAFLAAGPAALRSEERRVGKESRSRRGTKIEIETKRSGSYEIYTTGANGTGEASLNNNAGYGAADMS